MNKLNHEAELVVQALRVGEVYAKKRGVGKFESTDSAKKKVTYLYRLLVHDKLLQPLPEDQVSQQAIRHKLAMWAAKQNLKS